MLDELKNNIGNNAISWKNITTIFKEHIYEYWFSPEGDNVDLKMDIIGDELLRADCDVTDHYVESNLAYQDQITLRPKVYTINGEVGELVWYQRNSSSQTLGQVAQKLEGVISFLPIRSKGFTQMKKTIMKASQWVDTASNALTKLSSLIGVGGWNKGGDALGTMAMTRQEQAFAWLCWLRDLRQPLDVKTPWGVMKKYVITNLEFRQPRETKDKTLISITFKEFRTTSIQTVEFDSNKYQGNAALENQPESDQGKTAGEDVSLETETATAEDVAGNEDLLGTDYCTANAKDGTEFSIFYDETTKEINVRDETNGIWYDEGSLGYYEAIDNARVQCEKQVAGWDLPK